MVYLVGGMRVRTEARARSRSGQGAEEPANQQSFDFHVRKEVCDELRLFLNGN